jgi:hypothetical protein
MASRTEIRLADAADPIVLTVRVGIDSRIWSLNGVHLKNCFYSSTADNTLHRLRRYRRKGHSRSPSPPATQPAGRRMPGLGRAGLVMRAYFETLKCISRPVKNGFSTHLSGSTAAMIFKRERERGASYSIMTGGGGPGRIEIPETPLSGAVAVAEIQKKQGYNTVYSRHRNVWKHLWDRFDIGIEGDAYAQVTMRFNIYHSVIAAPLHTDHLPIGARGLSCSGLPGSGILGSGNFQYGRCSSTRRPNIARNILTYRISHHWRRAEQG